MKSLLPHPFSAAAETINVTLGSHHISRRTLIKGLGLMTGALILKPSFALSTTDYGVAVWKQMIRDLVTTVCPEFAAQRVCALVSRATVYLSPSMNDFHQSFSPQYILDMRVYPEMIAAGGRYFEFDRYPFFDSQNPCRRTKDINEIELQRFLNPGEVEFYNGVVSPCSERRPLSTQFEYDDFRRTAEYYQTDPDAWQSLYTRNVTDGRKSYLAYAARPRRNAQGRALKQVFVSPDSV